MDSQNSDPQKESVETVKKDRPRGAPLNIFSGILTLNKLIEDLRATANGILDYAIVERGAGWIRQLQVEFPQAHDLLMSVLYNPPEDVLRVLGKMRYELRELEGNEHVLAYIAALQSRLRGHNDKSRIGE